MDLLVGSNQDVKVSTRASLVGLHDKGHVSFIFEMVVNSSRNLLQCSNSSLLVCVTPDGLFSLLESVALLIAT